MSLLLHPISTQFPRVLLPTLLHRCVLTDHGSFVLINVYVPNAGYTKERPGLAAKCRFLAALKDKADGLLAAGRKVRRRLSGSVDTCH